jgi:DNA polymerase I
MAFSKWDKHRKKFPTIVLIDGSNLVYRALYAFKSLTSPSGRPTGALYGFIRLLDFYERKLNSNCIVVTWDSENSWRSAFFEGYKALRKIKHQEDPESQLKANAFSDVKMFCEFCGILSVQQEMQEADDLLASLAILFERDIAIVSDDKDLCQLVDDKTNIRVVKAAHGQIGVQIFDEERVKEKFGVSPRWLPAFLAIRGDSSDEIPGIPGFGPKRAIEVVNVLSKNGGKLKECFPKEACVLYKRNEYLVQLHRRLQLRRCDLRTFKNPNVDELKGFFEFVGFRRYKAQSLVKRFHNPTFRQFFLRSIIEH